MKKVKSEKEIQFEAKMKELEKKEKATRKENKVKYGPGRRGVMIIVSVVLCIGIAILGVYFVQQLLKDDKYTGGNEVVTTVTTTTTAATVPTGAGTTTPVEIYPEDAKPTPDDIDGDGIPNDDDTTPNGSSSDDLLDGGFGYDPIETPATSATTTVSEHNVQVTTSGGDRDEDGITIGMGGGHGVEEDFPSTTRGTDSSSATTSETSTSTSVSTTTSSRQTTAVTPSVTTTAERTTSSSSSSTRRTVPTFSFYIDPSETWGHSAEDYLE